MSIDPREALMQRLQDEDETWLIVQDWPEWYAARALLAVPSPSVPTPSPTGTELALAEAKRHIGKLAAYFMDNAAWVRDSDAARNFIGGVPSPSPLYTDGYYARRIEAGDRPAVPSPSAAACLQEMSARMAEDNGLWFVAETAAEAYLQQELRKLCAAIEGESIRFKASVSSPSTDGGDVLISKKDLADLRSAKMALPIEQRKHAKARQRIHELERALPSKAASSLTSGVTQAAEGSEPPPPSDIREALEAAAKVCERRASRHAEDRKRIEATSGHDPRMIDACIAAEDEGNEAADEIRALAALSVRDAGDGK